MRKIMDEKSEIIKTEIIRILNESGKIRGNELAKRVIEKVGNEKIVFREISELVEKGEIEKTVHSRSYIEYELIDLSESVNTQLKNLHNEINLIFEEIKKFQNSKDENFSYHERLRNTIHLIQIIQSAESIMKLLSYYSTFKKDKMFSQIKRKINDCWDALMNSIIHQPEVDFLNEIITNLQVGKKNQNNFN
jgi:DNA-binding HxlR family transcriptional regulator|tara:strand:- start:317 stop:892 length:576 start_codon:yes stop_codon:yes gene_type:complete